MQRIVLSFTIAGAVALGCGGGKSPSRGAGRWASTQPAEFHVGSAPQPPTTQPPQYSLEQVLDMIEASPQQRTAVAQVLDDAAKDWHAWYLSNAAPTERAVAAMRDAKANNDRVGLERIWHETIEANDRGTPRSSHAWQQIKQHFDPAQQQKMDQLTGSRLGGIGTRLHRAMSDLPEYDRADGPARCQPCHLPHVASST